MNSETNTPQPPQPVEEKATVKVYRSPQLIEYGNMQQLTNAVGMMGKMDGGMGMGMGADKSA